jgi:hypothetical protein
VRQKLSDDAGSSRVVYGERRKIMIDALVRCRTMASNGWIANGRAAAVAPMLHEPAKSMTLRKRQ